MDFYVQCDEVGPAYRSQLLNAGRFALILKLPSQSHSHVHARVAANYLFPILSPAV